MYFMNVIFRLCHLWEHRFRNIMCVYTQSVLSTKWDSVYTHTCCL